MQSPRTSEASGGAQQTTSGAPNLSVSFHSTCFYNGQDAAPAERLRSGMRLACLMTTAPYMCRTAIHLLKKVTFVGQSTCALRPWSRRTGVLVAQKHEVGVGWRSNVACFGLLLIRFTSCSLRILSALASTLLLKLAQGGWSGTCQRILMAPGSCSSVTMIYISRTTRGSALD